VVAAHFEPGEDLLDGVRQALKDQGIRSGYVPTITGQLAHARVRRFGRNPTASHPTEVVDLPGPLEVSGSGIFGMVEAPELGTEPFTLSGNVHGEPYVHLHVTVTSREETVSGHVAAGTLVNSFHPVSHFTVFLVEVVGLELQLRCDVAAGRTSYHQLVAAPGRG
jgi:predicted DNA-binding protein with PD1-like motif